MNRLLALLLCLVSTVEAQQILVRPYLQPGNASSLSKEQKVLIWQTDSIPGTFNVEYGIGQTVEAVPKILSAKISFDELKLKGKTTFLYRAQLTKLEFDADYVYRVSLNGTPVAVTNFSTRTKKSKTQFAVFGDCGAGTPEQAEIAYQVYQKKPQFVLITGDNVYSNGLESEYRKNFFPYYLAPAADPKQGAPLMSSVPFYMMVGNHDVRAPDLDKVPDGLAFFYYNDLPLNAPTTEASVKVLGSSDRTRMFKKNTSPRYPRIANYSFDYGNVHFVCLDANLYVNPLDPYLVAWITNDLKYSKADWKIVAFHHPGFNSSKAHYEDQQMRLIAPLIERLGVDIVLSGHVHNYQRTVPLTFKPKKDESGSRYLISPEGKVDGVFSLDTDFDGITNTKPQGILYIVTGAGGAPLYDIPQSGKPELWKHDPPENWVPFTAKFISDVHSFTWIETDGKKLVMKQLTGAGVELDSITVTK